MLKLVTVEKTSDPQQQVLNASLSILNNLGYGALRLTEVAKILKVSKQWVYYHYTDPEDILLRLARQWSESGQFHTLKALADDRSTGRMRVLAMAVGMFDWMAANPELARLGLVLYQLSPQIPNLSDFMKKARDAGRARIRDLLRNDPELTRMKNKDLENFVTILHSQMYGFFFYAVVMDQWDDLEVVRKNGLRALRETLSNATPGSR